MKLVMELLWMFLKTLSLIGILAGVWVGSGFYHAKEYRRDAEEVMKIRVRANCLRPDYVRDELGAREYDVTVREVDLISEKLALMNRKAEDLLDHADQVETMRAEYTQGKVRSPPGGVGGPAPKKTSR